VRTRVICTWKSPAIFAVWMATPAAAMPMPMTAALASSPVFLKAPAPASSAPFISAFTSPMAVLTPLEWPRNSMKTGGRAPMRESPPSRVALWNCQMLVARRQCVAQTAAIFGSALRMPGRT
jgi:hypothetical protein